MLACKKQIGAIRNKCACPRENRVTCLSNKCVKKQPFSIEHDVKEHGFNPCDECVGVGSGGSDIVTDRLEIPLVNSTDPPQPGQATIYIQNGEDIGFLFISNPQVNPALIFDKVGNHVSMRLNNNTLLFEVPTGGFVVIDLSGIAENTYDWIPTGAEYGYNVTNFINGFNESKTGVMFIKQIGANDTDFPQINIFLEQEPGVGLNYGASSWPVNSGGSVHAFVGNLIANWTL